MNIKSNDDLDECLLQAIVEATCYCLGDKSAESIFNHMKKKGVYKKDIPKKLDVFERELENIVGSENIKASRVAQILKKAYIAVFCMKLKINYLGNNSGFSEKIRKIKEIYFNNSV